MLDDKGNRVEGRVMNALHLHYLWNVTKTAVARGKRLEGLWEPGGELYDTMVDESSASGVVRWRPGTTAQRAWAACKARYGVMSDAGSTTGDDLRRLNELELDVADQEGDDGDSTFGEEDVPEGVRGHGEGDAEGEPVPEADVSGPR